MKNKSIYFKAAVALGIAFVIYRILRPNAPTTQEIGGEKPKPKPETNENQSYAKVPPAKLDLMTITQMAKNLEKAMSGLGTNEELIFAQFRKLTNEGDFIELSRAFGTRTIPSGYYFGETKGNMTTLLRSELSKEDLIKLNRILQSKGIKYRV